MIIKCVRPLNILRHDTKHVSIFLLISTSYGDGDAWLGLRYTYRGAIYMETNLEMLHKWYLLHSRPSFTTLCRRYRIPQRHICKLTDHQSSFYFTILSLNFFTILVFLFSSLVSLKSPLSNVSEPDLTFSRLDQ